jgi:GT2 family glycosyltransferase
MSERAAPQNSRALAQDPGRQPAPPRVVVAIPVRNEAQHIVPCLRALDAQLGATADRIVLLLNCCSDGTSSNIKKLAPSLRTPIEIIERNLRGTQATAGFARSLAMRYAAKSLADHDVIMTTDADGVASPDWIAANLAALHCGADVVCGRAVLDPSDTHLIPAHLHEDDARECRLSSLLDEIASVLDPDPHDPWPRHPEASGASMSVSVLAWRRAGGMPSVACGEDRAFIARLRSIDLRVRHAPGVVVTVSGRTHGRAAGGMADTIRRRMVQQDEFTDVALEPATDRYQRILLRNAARRLWADRRARIDDMVEALALSPRTLRAALSAPFFGQTWAMLERASPMLISRRVRFIDLEAEIDSALRLRDQAYGLMERQPGDRELMMA